MKIFNFQKNGMQKTKWYLFASCFLLMASCKTTYYIPEEWKAGYRNSAVDKRLFKNQLIHFLDYSAYENTVISSYEFDSSLSWGIIVPASNYTFITSDHTMLFGNAVDTCNIRYTYHLKYYCSNNRSLLMDILDKDSYNKERETTQTLELFKTNGFIGYRGLNGEANFEFEENVKTDGPIKGQLIFSNDTLTISSLDKNDLYSFNATKGIRLRKNNLDYALLLKGKLNYKNSILISNNASSDEQFIIAAYLAVVAWHFL